ncbi:MAG: response regulator, partial [Magnetococcales bacterium]|nr:response regulator [Magnetococcales bacterium]
MKFFQQYRRLTGKFLLYLLPSVILAVVVGGALFALFTHMQQQEDFAKRQKNTLSALSNSLQSPMWNYDTHTIKAILQTFSQHEEISGIEVRGSKGQLVASFGVFEAGSDLSHKRDIIHSGNAGDLSLGEVLVQFNRQILYNSIKQQIINTAVLLVFLSTALIASAYLSTWIIMIQPLKKLQQNIKNSENSLHPSPIDNNVCDEIAEVVDSYNNLLEKFAVKQEQLLATKQSADFANQAKSDFLATMSHEVRTPMNAVQGAIELLRRKTLKDDQVELVNTISYASGNLLNILDDILDLSKIEVGKLTLNSTAFNVRSLLEKTVSAMQPSAKKKELQLQLVVDEAIPTSIMGDASRIRQIFWNLLSNAVKYTDKGEVALHATKLKNIKGKVHIEFQVSDTGIGIPKEMQSVIFDPFQQVDSSISRLQKGTGLGLSICKRLVQLMGGTIVLENRNGGGSLFRVSLAFQEADEKTGVNLPATNTIRNNTSILLVEDELVSQLVVQALLSDEGYKVMVSSSGAEALEMLYKQYFEVVLMDLRMPEMDGFETTRRIRAMPDLRVANSTIIAFTGDVMKDTVERCLSENIDAVVAKPIDIDEMNRVIAELLNK